jgi:hypothetical protein
MRAIRVFICLAFVSAFALTAFGQKSEVALTVNEQFVDAALDAVFAKGDPPSVALKPEAADPKCAETITLLRELNGTKSSVRFREGRIIVPLAFRGSYKPPLIGCVDFSGTAEAVVEPEFDAQGQRVIAKAKLTNVSLNGTGGVGGALMAKLMQTSVDEKINPVELIRLEKLSFLFPIQNAGALRLNAVGFRYAVQNGSVTFYIPYEFVRT